MLSFRVGGVGGVFHQKYAKVMECLSQMNKSLRWPCVFHRPILLNWRKTLLKCLQQMPRDMRTARRRIKGLRAQTLLSERMRIYIYIYYLLVFIHTFCIANLWYKSGPELYHRVVLQVSAGIVLLFCDTNLAGIVSPPCDTIRGWICIAFLWYQYGPALCHHLVILVQITASTILLTQFEQLLKIANNC